MRMFAYHLCETPPVERTADAFEAHSVSVVVPPTATTYVRVRTSDYSNAPGSLPGFDTHRGPARGLTSVDGRAEGGWAGDGGYRWSGWPYGADDGGPYGPAGPWGDDISKLVAGA